MPTPTVLLRTGRTSVSHFDKTLRHSARACFRAAAKPITITVITVIAAAVLLSARPANAQLVPGDILLNNYNGNNVQRYSATGTLLNTYTGTGAQYVGAGITPDGNIVSTFNSPASGIVIYSPSGTLLTSFNTPVFNTNPNIPSDVSVFADGTLAISDQGGKAIREYTQTGVFVRSITGFGIGVPEGNVVAPDNSLYVADYQNGTIFHFNETGSLLSSFSSTFPAFDLVVSPTDGSLFIANANTNAVVHTSTTGTVLGSFNSGVNGVFQGIGISNDGTTIYAIGTSSTTVRALNSTTGALVNSFAISTPNTPTFLTVVPSASAAPEPGSIALLALTGLPALGVIMRRRCKTA